MVLLSLLYSAMSTKYPPLLKFWIFETLIFNRNLGRKTKPTMHCHLTYYHQPTKLCSPHPSTSDALSVRTMNPPPVPAALPACPHLHSPHTLPNPEERGHWQGPVGLAGFSLLNIQCMNCKIHNAHWWRSQLAPCKRNAYTNFPTMKLRTVHSSVFAYPPVSQRDLFATWMPKLGYECILFRFKKFHFYLIYWDQSNFIVDSKLNQSEHKGHLWTKSEIDLKSFKINLFSPL